MRQFKEENLIKATPCDVFIGENLNYFFLGRPAYKYYDDGSEGEYWEFPCCFIFDFKTFKNAGRIFPFDSGAFHAKRFPSYLRMMELASFEAGPVTDAPQKIIGAFFGSVSNYFNLKAKAFNDFQKEFALGVFDAELKALHRLACEKAPNSFDDRRLTVELQNTSDIDLTVIRPLAVIAPSEYYDDVDFRDHVVKVWKAVPISYSVGPLSVANSYGQIYNKVFDFYRSKGYL